MHNTLCATYRDTVKGLKDLLDKLVEEASLQLMEDIDSKFDAHTFFSIQ